MSSGFGTQQNDSRDEPTITESIELGLMAQYNSTDTDPGDHFLQRNDSIEPPISCTHYEHDEAYLQYQKSLLTRSPSYRKSIDRLSISSETSQKSLIPSKSKSNDNLNNIMIIKNNNNKDNISYVGDIKRISSGHSLNTLSIDQDDLLNQVNLRDELLNCEQKELFQFLQDDLDNSNNYFSDAVGYSSAIMDADTDSLILDSKKDDSIFSHGRKPSSCSIKSNLSCISNSIIQQIDHIRNNGNNGTNSICGSIDKMFGRQDIITQDGNNDQVPLVGNSEFDNIIMSFEKELEEIKKSTTSLERRLSTLSEPSPQAEECSKNLATYIINENIDEEEIPLVQKRQQTQRDLVTTTTTIVTSITTTTSTSSTINGFNTTSNNNNSQNSIQMKRRSLEKQKKIDDDFSVTNEIRKICDQMQAPFAELGMFNTNTLNITSNASGSSNASPFLRRKSDFYTNIERLKRRSLIERVEEVPEDERSPYKIESDKLPRKNLNIDLNVESISLKSTTSYENILIKKQLRNQEIASEKLNSNEQKQQYLKHHQDRQQQKQHHHHQQKILPQIPNETLSTSTELRSKLKPQIEEVKSLQNERSPRGSPKKSTEITKLSEKPWHCLVSYVDDLTVGGRRNSQGTYNDPMSFPSFGRNKAPKVPQDCFPQKCYDQ